jgi:RNA polymerase-binding transcription factor DksA
MSRRAQPLRSFASGPQFSQPSPPEFLEEPAARLVNEDGAMDRIQVEAREVLLRRRRVLSEPDGPGHGDPSARWVDYEAALEPISEQVRRELADIDAALMRIASGNYGVCESCGGPMGLQRLRALPEARYCIGCSGEAPALD